MARYTDDSRERVRDAVDFVDLVGSRIELRKAGVRRYVGLCPFHEERSPSFGIDPVEKLYHCFGCGVGGDVFKWVMEIESVPFGEALELLADRYNVALERTDEDPRAAERRTRRDRLHGLLERTAAYYVRMLWESAEAAGAREYLTSRGLAEPTLRQFRVGFSPSAWDRIVTASVRAGYSADELTAAGLASRGRDGRLLDRFRGRLMFPWTDTRGRVLGFGARALAEGQQPKYLNSAEGEVFHKGRQVYGVDLARKDAAKAGAVVLVEGYTDVIALHQAGLRNVVGQMGTALTAEQATVLAGLAPTVLLCLDADAAGQQAMLRAASVVRAMSSPPELRVVPLPPGADPADVVARDGADAVRELLGRALPFARWHVEHLLARGDLDSTEGRDRLLTEIAPIVNGLPQGILRQELVRLVADRLALSDNLMNAVLSQDAPARATPAGGGAGHGGGRRLGGSGGRGVAGGPGSPWRERGSHRGERRSGAPLDVSPPQYDDDPAVDALLDLDPGREDDASAPEAAERIPAAAGAAQLGTGAARDASASSPHPKAGRSRAGGPADTARASNPAVRALDRRADTEHAFLALCLAFPDAGRRRLAGLDLDAAFAGTLTRRAAAHLREHLEAPSAGIAPDDDALTAVIAELVMRAGSLEQAEPSEFARAAHMLDLARLDREIAAARAAQEPVSDLAIERQRILGEIRKVTH